MKLLLIKSLFLIIIFNACAQKKRAQVGETKFQIQLNTEYKDASKTPLTETDLKHFKGLDFFPVDSTYIVKATLKRTPESPWFIIKTTTNRLTEYRKYGDLMFTLQHKPFLLEVYQNKSFLNQPEYLDYLFLPFLDNTNGESSYSGGRYISLHIPDGDAITINFNEAYNPYCAYNKKYSCPIVPAQNYLPIAIKAGVKAFKKNTNQ